MIHAALLALALADPSPAPSPAAEKPPVLALYRDGFVWKDVPLSSVFTHGRTVAVADVVKQLGFPSVRAVGVRTPRKAEVLDWARLTDPTERPTLVLAGTDVVNLIAYAGPRAPLEKNLLGVHGLDLRGPFDAQGNLLPPDAGSPKPIEVVKADGSKAKIELSAVVAAATQDATWNGRGRKVVPLLSLLGLAGISGEATLRLTTEQGTQVVSHGGEGLADASAWMVMLNKRGFPVLLHRDALQAADSGHGSGGGGGAGRGAGDGKGRAALEDGGELRRLERIEVLPPQQHRSGQ
jgi:hypothetical protein